MAKQVITFGTPPTGIGGDSYRTAFGKCNENFTELYEKVAYFDGAPKAASSFTIYRDVLSNYRATASLTGALVIHLPRARNKSTTMVSFKIRGFNYLGNKGEWLLQVGGYNYTSGWTQCSANLNGPAPFTQVQLGMASDHQVIIIGTVSTVWAYPRFNIEEITAGYSNHASGWDDITVAYETDLSAYTGIVTPTLYGWPQVLTAEKLTTPRTIGGVSFDGSQNINLPGVNTTGNQNTTGNAATATKLQTARTIGGVSFDGTSNINLPGVNTTGNQSTSGNAGSATKLATARTLTVGRTGKTFDGSANVAWTATEILPTATSGQFLKFDGTNWVAAADNNTTYSTMTAVEAAEGTATTSLLVSPAVLKQAITTHAPTPPVFTTNVAGLVPARVGTTSTRFLREDGTWVVPVNTTYSAMSQTEADTGTATTARVITAAVLKKAVEKHAPVGGQFLGTAAIKAIAYNAQIIAEDITIPSGYNGLSAGPITINDGNTVTISDGATWTIV